MLSKVEKRAPVFKDYFETAIVNRYVFLNILIPTTGY